MVCGLLRPELHSQHVYSMVFGDPGLSPAKGSNVYSGHQNAREIVACIKHLMHGYGH